MKNKMLSSAIILQQFFYNAKRKMRAIGKRKVAGAVAFEYIIVLVVMVGVIFGAFGLLSEMVTNKLTEIKAKIENIDTGISP